ncbi:MAG: VanZ family protein [Oscillospiraceae bacterium]|nr:VanZ family protein [Oscillospiraceae bacterium]
MLSPIKTMFLHFPLRAYSTVIILALVSWYAFRRIRQGCRAGTIDKDRGTTSWLLVDYVLVLLFLTVLGRRSLDYDRYNFEVLYSYRDVLTTGDAGMAIQIAVNIAAFIPVGALSSLIVKRGRFPKGLLLGVVLSLCIEILQFLLRCGTAEIDDLISNSLGTLIGCLIAGIVIIIADRHRKLNKKSAES